MAALFSAKLTDCSDYGLYLVQILFKRFLVLCLTCLLLIKRRIIFWSLNYIYPLSMHMALKEDSTGIKRCFLQICSYDSGKSCPQKTRGRYIVPKF